MGSKTKIEWVRGDDGSDGASWNLIIARDPGPVGGKGWHCEILTPGCERCYAQSLNKRLGTHRAYKVTEREHVSVSLDEKILAQPLHWQKPRRIFVGSMTDIFGSWIEDEWLNRIFTIMEQAPQHQFLVLTKRAERMRDYCQSREPLGNVALGVSVEDQRRWDERVPALAQTPSALRWVSLEPQLERVDTHFDLMMPQGPRWIVIGGESGPGARPFEIEWARAVVAQCKAARVSCFVKQLGSIPISEGERLLQRHRKGGDIEEWPVDLRVREHPNGSMSNL